MKDQIIELLDSLHIEYRWLDHPPVFTVTESSKLLEDKKPIKNLLLQEKNNGKKFLVIMVGNERLDLRALKEKLDVKKLQFVSDQTLLQTFGVNPGAVSIFGLLHEGSSGVITIIDRNIMSDDVELGFHPNDNTASIFFSAKELEKILQAMKKEYIVTDLY